MTETVYDYRLFKLHLHGYPIDVAEEIAESNVDSDLAIKALNLCIKAGYEDDVAAYVALWLIALRDTPIWETTPSAWIESN